MSVAQGTRGHPARSLSHPEWLFAQTAPMPKDGSALPKTYLPPASAFVRAVRDFYGLTQERFADWLGVGDRSTVAKWETDKDKPSWESIGRLLVALGVVDATGKRLRSPTGNHVESAPMTAIESQILEELRKLPEREQLKVFACAVQLVEKAASSSQPPVALNKG